MGKVVPLALVGVWYVSLAVSGLPALTRTSSWHCSRAPAPQLSSLLTYETSLCSKLPLLLQPTPTPNAPLS